ncbi:response regulator transcription factor, partial [Petrocella sp. FN5]|uniref:response regulator transcription factor n=1 Tax=Petrocella sp. FN5 TaxID=3032002 RepID=UPI0023DAC0F4
YQVVIIDDEAVIRKGLIGYINWQDLNCRIVGDFDNGLDAIEYLKTSSVDIVISDIKMPGANGIDVSKYMYEHHPHSKIILYTGYSDFEYAKSAIKYNVSDFIIKPSTIENIINTIHQTIKKIDEQRMKEHHIQSLELKLSDVKKKEKLNVIKDFVEGVKMDSSTLEETLKSHDIYVDQFCLLLYKMSGQKTINHPQIIQFISLSLNDLDQYTFLLNDSTYGSLVAFDKHIDYDPVKLLANKCHDINSFVDEYIKEKIFIGISNLHTNLEAAPIAFMEAQRCLDNSFYGKNHLTIYSEFDEPKENPSYVEINLEHIMYCIKKDKCDEAIQLIKSMFTTMSDHKEPIDYIKSMGIAIYTICINAIHKHNLKLNDVFVDQEPYKQILNASCIDDLIQVLSHMITTITQYLCEGNNYYIITQVNAYIESHYQHPIKLKDISEHVHINSSYLSRLYKDKTGQTITETLRNIRIEKAKELLKNDNLKTYAIAVLVGFDDPAYFSYVFKQHTGYTPSQYKNNPQS